MCWYIGTKSGYLDGWYARGIAEDQKFIERAQRAASGEEV
jgi:hypothetical protein